MRDTTADDMAHQLADLAATIPEPIGSLIDDAVAALAATAPTNPINLDDEAPDFSLPDASGREVRLSERLATSPVVLTFYRGGWCPFCHIELRALRAALPALQARGASLIAISPQTGDDTGDVSSEPNFDVLSDRDQTTIRDYGLQCQVTGSARSLYDVLQLDLAAQNADQSWTVPIPATYVIDQSARVVAAHVDPDYRTRMDVSTIVAALDRLVRNATPKECT